MYMHLVLMEFSPEAGSAFFQQVDAYAVFVVNFIVLAYLGVQPLTGSALDSM